MDQSAPTNPNDSQPSASVTSPVISSLIPPEQTENLFKELHMQNLPSEQKEQMLQTMIDTVMDRIFLRIDPELSDQAKQQLDALSTKPNSDQEVIQLLISNVPNLDKIAQEEIDSYREELKLQIDTVIQTLDTEAAKLTNQPNPTPANVQPETQTVQNQPNDSSNTQQ